MMRLYDCQVRLGGTTSSEVPKSGISAAEILTLRHIHGDDSVVKITPKNRSQASHAAERDHLMRTYELSDHHAGLIASLFGKFGDLPENLDPETEERCRELAEQKDAEEAARKLEIDQEVERRVAEELEARVRADEIEKANTAAVHAEVPEAPFVPPVTNGWSPEKAADIERKRLEGLAAAKAKADADKAQAREEASA